MSKEKDDSKHKYGCKHYKRKCAFISPCCEKVYTCRQCHNEQEKHEIDRHAIKQVKCLNCNGLQKPSPKCRECGVSFGKYFCGVCNLFDDEEKGQFHCPGCGICRVGGAENFFHCDRCSSCLARTLKEEHKCLENASRTNCPVCLEDMHTSREPIHVPRCGHHIHLTCYRDMVKHGSFTCPICGESYSDMKELWERVDEEIADTPMPDEYKNLRVGVLCKDCHKDSVTPFHVIGLKCQQCGSYNTCRSGEGEPATEGPASGGENQASSRENQASSRENQASSRENLPSSRENQESSRENLPSSGQPEDTLDNQDDEGGLEMV